MLRYSIALINVFWSQDDINTRLFENETAQKTYFDSLIGGKFSPLLNFNMGDNITTSITFRDTTNRSAEELLRCNYAVIKKEENNIISYRYFFANAVRQDSGNQIIVDLDLDDIQTNYIKYRNNISECLIKRACLNRFVNGENGRVKFDTNIDSKLFVDEGFNTEKRLISREVLNLYSTPYPELTTWLNSNILGWLYCFCDSKHSFNFNSPENAEISGKFLSLQYNTKSGGQRIYNTMSCICVPVMKSNKRIYMHYSYEVDSNTIERDIEISIDGIKEFFGRNSDGAFIYSFKFSNMPPFTNYQNNYYFNNDNLYINGNILQIGIGTDAYRVVSSSTGWGNSNTITINNNTVTSSRVGVIMMSTQQNINLSISYQNDIEYEFNKADIIGQPKNQKLEPKLLLKSIKSISLSDSSENGFEYDLLKLGKNDLSIIFSEAITPDISKKYIRFGNTEGYYINETSENLTGFLNSDDTSITLETSAYQNMLANNKNYFLQNSIGRVFGGVESVVGAITFKNPTNLIGGVLGYVKDRINQNLNIDNLKSSPSSVNSMKGNILFDAMISDLGIVVSKYEITEIEKRIIYDNLFKYGYNLNITDKITNYDNIRTYFNYIEAEVETIDAPISNTEKTRLKNKLQSIRFWNTDTIAYDLENYERSLTE